MISSNAIRSGQVGGQPTGKGCLVICSKGTSVDIFPLQPLLITDH